MLGINLPRIILCGCLLGYPWPCYVSMPVGLAGCCCGLSGVWRHSISQRRVVTVFPWRVAWLLASRVASFCLGGCFLVETLHMCMLLTLGNGLVGRPFPPAKESLHEGPITFIHLASGCCIMNDVFLDVIGPFCTHVIVATTSSFFSFLFLSCLFLVGRAEFWLQRVETFRIQKMFSYFNLWQKKSYLY